MNNKPYITLEEALAARQEGKSFLQRRMAALVAAVQELPYTQRKSLIRLRGIMMIRKVFLFLKEKDMQSLEIVSFL